IHGDLRPYAGIAGPFPRAILPGFVSRLSGIGNGIEAPDLLAGSNVEGANKAFRVRAGPVVEGEAFFHRRSDNHGIVHDGRRGVQTDPSPLEVYVFVLSIN